MAENPKSLYVISGVAAALMLIDLLGADVTIVTFSLFVVALLPWFLPYLKEIYLPGGGKIVLNELKRVYESIEQSGLAEAAEEVVEQSYSYDFVSQHDPVIALAGLRLEIEKRLNQLMAYAPGPQAESGKTYPLHRKIDILERHEVLPAREAGIIRNLLPILDQAIHDGKIARQARDYAVDIGITLLSSLDRVIAGLEHSG